MYLSFIIIIIDDIKINNIICIIIAALVAVVTPMVTKQIVS